MSLGLFILMDKLEFAREMDAYLSRRKRKRFSFFRSGLFSFRFAGFLSSTQVVESKDSAVVPQTVKYSVPVEVLADSNDVSVEYDSEKKGVFSKFLEWLVAGRQVKDEDVSVVDVSSALVEKELLADMRELARISILNFRKLPAQRIRELKNSEDFSVFKRILGKHGLSRDS